MKRSHSNSRLTAKLNRLYPSSEQDYAESAGLSRAAQDRLKRMMVCAYSTLPVILAAAWRFSGTSETNVRSACAREIYGAAVRGHSIECLR